MVADLVGAQAGGVFVDATFGRGGHSRGLLAALSADGRLHGLDMDPLAVAAGSALAEADARFSMHRGPFASMAQILPPGLVGAVDGILYDLGISSPQLDDPTRGFRPEQDGPLDLRFDPDAGVPAWQFLQSADREEIAAAIAAAGDGQDAASAARVADALALARMGPCGGPRTTGQLAALVAAARCGGDYQPMHAAKLTFQALRIHLHDEFGQLRQGLQAGLQMLRPGGRLGIITWKHSECQARGLGAGGGTARGAGSGGGGLVLLLLL